MVAVFARKVGAFTVKGLYSAQMELKAQKNPKKVGKRVA